MGQRRYQRLPRSRARGRRRPGHVSAREDPQLVERQVRHPVRVGSAPPLLERRRDKIPLRRIMNYRNLTFESFVRLPSSACAYQLCRAVTRSAPTGPRVVLLHGLTGVGKTHLLGATAWAFRLLHPDRRVVVTTAHELRYALVQAIRVDRVREFEAGFLRVALALLRGFHTLFAWLWTQHGL